MFIRLGKRFDFRNFSDFWKFAEKNCMKGSWIGKKIFLSGEISLHLSKSSIRERNRM